MYLNQWKLKGFQITMKQSHGAMKAKIHLLMRIIIETIFSPEDLLFSKTN